LKSEREAVAVLENDLIEAHKSIESTKALLKCSNVPIPVAEARLQKQQQQQQQQQQQIRAVAEANLSTASVTAETMSKKSYSPGKLSRVSSARGGTGVSAESHELSTTNDGSDGMIEDVEKGSGGLGTAQAVLGTESSGDRFLSAVQSQRDRYMKQAKEKENELIALKNRCDRIQEEQLVLRSENLELYRRLRTLRVSSSRLGMGGSVSNECEEGDISFGSSGSSINNGTPSKPRTRRNVKEDMQGAYCGNSMDALDTKYNKMYEEHIDPFRMEELDRQSVISKMNVMERGLVVVVRLLLQDQWARHALMVYILLVHCFAIGYVCQILTPELIDEIDTNMKQKWSEETLSAVGEHPELGFN
jgi:hypothetical protein